MKKYVKVKELEKSESSYNDSFQKMYQGRLFEVLSEDEFFYKINNGSQYNSYFKGRFEPFNTISLPDELFRI